MALELESSRINISLGVNNIEIALSHIEILIDFLKSEKQEIEKNIQELKFFQKNNQSIKFEKLIVEQGLNMKIRVKSTLIKILSSLKPILDSESEYKLPEQVQLKMLSSILGSRNFSTNGDIREKLDYCSRVSEIGKELNFNDLIILLGEKIELTIDEKEFSFSQEIIDRILEIGKITENNQVALAIVKIFNFNKILLSNCEEKIEEIVRLLQTVLSRISYEKTEIVLKLSKKFKIVNNSNLLEFMHKTLIENEIREKDKKHLKFYNR
ncbi:unnamed protein product [Didymodactylos carnosus]|uniref:Uncharacterized protein n=1 Tax=Didymodactylos carnosus TaxID=1234261 RepID=A0A814KZH9_9BILA|nr:unnamed protein product [Didymodactylos carnosus]CAF3825318.1 unnamed protein product [Didymodactylos carnosus]